MSARPTLARVLAAGAMVATAGLCIHAVARSPVHDRNGSTATPADVGADRRPDADPLAMLRAEIAGLRDELQDSARDRSGTGDGTLLTTSSGPEGDRAHPGAEVEDLLDPQEAREAELEATEATSDFLHGALDEQARDVDWAGGIEVAAATAVEEHAGLQMRDISCATNLCRMEFEPESRQALDEFMEQAGFVAPFATEGFFRQVNDGEDDVVMELFFAREGHPLPSPPDDSANG